jgi:uncharacterized protein with NAD-binding domain and iron-sulfur cluster
VTVRVAVLGAGVAGLTVAHELVDRGFHVDVYEARDVPGGQARSYRARLLDLEGHPIERGPVPVEHGFRFFPGFYRHTDDTMQRIQAADAYRGDGRETVLDCLVSIQDELLSVAGSPPITVPASAPLKVQDIRNALRIPGKLVDVGLTNDDLATFADKLWQIATSCPERRDGEYEQLGWRDFVDSKNRSDEYYWYLASGLTRVLVAARARYASTKTMGNIALRLFAVVMNVGQTTDRALCGPTNDVWINPWIQYIEGNSSQGRPRGHGTIHEKTAVTALDVRDGKVHAWVRTGDEHARDAGADYVVSALPVEVLAKLVKASPELRARDQFQNVVTIAEATGTAQCLRRMSGLQIYCKEGHTFGPRDAAGKALRLNKGHQLLLDSPWGLTSIDQGLFWVRPPEGVGDVLSIDISSWDMKGMNGKKASDCSELEVFQEVCAEMRAGLGNEYLVDDAILGWSLDTNTQGLLVNRVDSWRLRPTAKTDFANFMIAGDYTQTLTDLACMEGANESGRTAVNEILRVTRSPEEPCPIWGPAQPAMLLPFQALDRIRYERGLPWSGTPAIGPWLVGCAQVGAVAADPLVPPLVPPATEKAFRVPKSEWDDVGPEMPVRALTAGQIVTALERFQEFAQPGRSDAMFKEWRLYEREHEPKYLVPLHVYDADTLILYGQAKNFEALRRLTKGTGFHPVSCNIAGEKVGFAELWIVHYYDTSTGPCFEVALNFPTSKDEHKAQYRWQSPLSAMIPMMDPTNRLFTPQIVLQQLAAPPGCLEYGNKIFGMNKLKGNITITPGSEYAFRCLQLQDQLDGPERPVDGAPLVVEGRVDVQTSRAESAALAFELARELGPIAAARNMMQIQKGAELTGGLATRDFRDTEKVVGLEVNAVYKFAPTICGYRAIKEFEPGPAPLGRLLDEIGFVHTIAAHEPHLKSVLYTDACPTPND